MNKYEELIVWQVSIDLASEIHKMTKVFPDEERFGLTSQMRRAAVSIASNLAEGAGRNNRKEFRNFVGIANGSACELGSQLIICGRVDLIPELRVKELRAKLSRVHGMLYRLRLSLEN